MNGTTKTANAVTGKLTINNTYPKWITHKMHETTNENKIKFMIRSQQEKHINIHTMTTHLLTTPAAAATTTTKSWHVFHSLVWFGSFGLFFIHQFCFVLFARLALSFSLSLSQLPTAQTYVFTMCCVCILQGKFKYTQRMK